jgi:hypothetical protein
MCLGLQDAAKHQSEPCRESESGTQDCATGLEPVMVVRCGRLPRKVGTPAVLGTKERMASKRPGLLARAGAGDTNLRRGPAAMPATLPRRLRGAADCRLLSVQVTCRLDADQG